MSIIDRFLNAIKLNDDFDDEDDFLDEEDDLDEADAPEDNVKPRKRFFSRFTMDDEDEDDDDFDEFDEPAPKPSRSKASSREVKKTPSAATEKKAVRSGSSTARKVSYASSASTRAAEKKPVERPKPAARKAPVQRRKGSLPMEVNVVRPSSMEDTREIADTLMDDCTVVLNLEGLDVDIAQRVIDFTCGVCYSLHGNLQKISSYIFILTPSGVDISGDFQSILDGAFDLPSMRGLY